MRDTTLNNAAFSSCPGLHGFPEKHVIARGMTPHALIQAIESTSFLGIALSEAPLLPVNWERVPPGYEKSYSITANFSGGSKFSENFLTSLKKEFHPITELIDASSLIERWEIRDHLISYISQHLVHRIEGWQPPSIELCIHRGPNPRRLFSDPHTDGGTVLAHEEVNHFLILNEMSPNNISELNPIRTGPVFFAPQPDNRSEWFVGSSFPQNPYNIRAVFNQELQNERSDVHAVINKFPRLVDNWAQLEEGTVLSVNTSRVLHLGPPLPTEEYGRVMLRINYKHSCKGYRRWKTPES